MRAMLAAMWTGLAVVAGGAPGGAAAQTPSVVVELYTSQGCSSCPPADALLTELAGRDDVIALALHVDYWDYIGWKDSFARPENTARQRAYARAVGQRSIYTPQMIVGGVDHVVGYKPMRLAQLIEEHHAAPMFADVTARRDGDSVVVEAPARALAAGPIVVQLVRYMAQGTVDIRRGENAGKVLTYSNVVTDWQVLRRWDGYQPLSLRAPIRGGDHSVVILQQDGPGPIVAAFRLN